MEASLDANRSRALFMLGYAGQAAPHLAVRRLKRCAARAFSSALSRQAFSVRESHRAGSSRREQLERQSAVALEPWLQTRSLPGVLSAPEAFLEPSVSAQLVLDMPRSGAQETGLTLLTTLASGLHPDLWHDALPHLEPRRELAVVPRAAAAGHALWPAARV
jgi:hypothetical protein